jgi:hypothetical protein
MIFLLDLNQRGNDFSLDGVKAELISLLLSLVNGKRRGLEVLNFECFRLILFFFLFTTLIYQAWHIKDSVSTDNYIKCLTFVSLYLQLSQLFSIW